MRSTRSASRQALPDANTREPMQLIEDEMLRSMALPGVPAIGVQVLINFELFRERDLSEYLLIYFHCRYG